MPRVRSDCHKPLLVALVFAAAALPAPSAADAATTLTYSAPSAHANRLTLIRAGSNVQLRDAAETVVAQAALADIDRIVIEGSNAVDDTLTVDLSGGLLPVPTHFDGGAGGFDTLNIHGGAVSNSSDTASGPQSGTIALDGMRVDYSNVEPITDTTPVTNYTFNAFSVPTLSLDDGAATGDGLLRISDLAPTPSFESTEFSNKANVTINTLGATGTSLYLANTESSTGLASLTVNGGSGHDSFTVQNTTVPTAVLGSSGDDSFLLAGDGAGALTMDGQSGSDLYRVAFGRLAGPAMIADTGTVGYDLLDPICTNTTAITANAVNDDAESVGYSGIDSTPTCTREGARGPQGAGAQGPQGPQGPVAFRLTVALLNSRVKVRRGQSAKIAYLSTADANLTVDVDKGKSRVTGATARTHVGRNTLKLKTTVGKRKLPAGTYSLHFRFKSADGQTASQNGRLTVHR